jgi:hypothetical protein
MVEINSDKMTFIKFVQALIRNDVDRENAICILYTLLCDDYGFGDSEIFTIFHVGSNLGYAASNLRSNETNLNSVELCKIGSINEEYLRSLDETLQCLGQHSNAIHRELSKSKK